VCSSDLRLEKIAKGGQILITEDTFQEVRHEIEAEKLDAVSMKGIGRNINIYNVLGVKPHIYSERP